MIVLIRIQRTSTDNTHLKRLAKCILLVFPLFKELDSSLLHSLYREVSFFLFVCGQKHPII